MTTFEKSASFALGVTQTNAESAVFQEAVSFASTRGYSATTIQDRAVQLGVLSITAATDIRISSVEAN